MNMNGFKIKVFDIHNIPPAYNGNKTVQIYSNWNNNLLPEAIEFDHKETQGWEYIVKHNEGKTLATFYNVTHEFYQLILGFIKQFDKEITQNEIKLEKILNV